MAHSVELSLHVDCRADAHSSVLQLMMLQTLSSACLQTAATLQFHAGQKNLVNQASSLYMYSITLWIITYQIVSYFFFLGVVCCIGSLKLPETFIEVRVILHVPSLCILFTMITFAVNGSKFFSRAHLLRCVYLWQPLH